MTTSWPRGTRVAAVLTVIVVSAVAVVGTLAAGGGALLDGARWVAPAAAAPSQEGPTDHAGEIFSFGITVPAQPIVAGDTITFPNNSDRPHTITDRGGTFDSNEIAPGSSGTVTFDTPGRVEVFCRINPSTMNAVVQVDPGDKPPKRTRVQLYDEFREGETRRFDPADLVVDAGTELTVANVGGLEHTLTADDGSFTTGVIAPGAEQGTFAGTSAALVLDDAGTFAVFCELFPDEMRGTIEVVAEVEATTTTEAADATTTTAAGEAGGDAEDEPPDGEAAAAAAGGGGTDTGAVVGAALAVLVGLAAIAVALAGGSSKKASAGEAF